MGNRIEDKNNDEFLKAVQQMRKSRNESGIDKVSTHLEQRYKDSLMQSLRKQQMSKTIKRLLADCIQKKIKKQDLTSTIAVLNSLRSNNAEQLLKTIISPVKETDQSKNVVVRFDKKKPKNRRASSQSKSINNWYREQDTLEGRVKYTGQFICKQLNKPYHPFRLLCKRFTDIIMTYEYTQTRSANEQQYQNKQELQRKSIKDFCLFLVAGCVSIYRKWIIEYTGLEDKKYQKWMYSLVLNQIWAVNQASMSTTMLNIISKAKIPLKINFQLLSSCSAIGIIHPKDFSIDPQFQIQGNYFMSIYTLSTLSQKPKPIQLLKHLQNIQKSICLDIDNYHKLQQKGQVYQINADNIMGIVAYILTKNTNKIEDISNILLFLKMIYGQGIFYNMDTSSYMYSTIWSAIQYIETKKFQLPKNNQNQIDKQLKDTNCAESSSSFISHKSNNNLQQPKNVENLQKQ